MPGTAARVIDFVLTLVSYIVGAGYIIFLLNTIRRNAPCVGNLLDGFGFAFKIIFLNILEGLLIGLMGAVIAFGLQWLLYEAISKGISGSDTLQLLRVVSFRKIWGPVAGVFGLVGILVGVGGSLTAIRKFLRV